MQLRTAYLCFGLLLLLAGSSHQATLANATYYVGAVAEYYPVTSGTNGTVISTANANNYATFVKKASSYSADIIVFPEGTLTAGLQESSTNRTNYTSYSSFIPNESEGVIPCGNASSTVIEALKIMSCAARNYSMYILVNVNEKENCTNATSCPSDGYYFYSTNVVFNRSGSIISKYRKYNLFNQPGFDITSSAQNATFVSDFNVTFGHFIGFDITYRYPALSLLENVNVTDILFPSRWYSQLPYTTAVQVQAAWAHRNNVNFLAAGYSDPSTGSGGAGLYAGNSGIIISAFSESPSNLLLVARIPKINGTRAAINSSSNLTYKFDSTEITTRNVLLSTHQVVSRENISPYTTSLIGLNNATYNQTICNSGLCCKFNVSVVYNSTLVSSSNNSYYRYRFAVFNGVKTYSNVITNGIQVCSIIACINDTQDSCAYRYDTNATLIHPTNFTFISITGNFSNQTSYFQLPYTLATNLLPLNSSSYSFALTNLNSTYNTIGFNLTSPQSSLFTYAIWGRNFATDGLSIATTSSAVRPIPMILGIVMIILGVGNM
ncbi:vanin-like protein 1 [Cephus cinctus]|uniref:Vanin-like protein 1 n=1 Tax=Cephus cinctus TaxID=211228 RepID=A0AAJ7C244_CEPCN|nr:vanin-like protein 1 [Cephus cinctus]XP_024943201.1 vanin-like protein 1 [Cephus cinctus]